MIRNAVGFLGLLVLLPALQARDKAETPTPAQQYQALEKEYETAQMEFRKAYKEAKTLQEQQKVVQEKAPQPDKFALRFLELAEKHPKDPAAVDALVWIVTYRAAGSPRTKALKILLRDHVHSAEMYRPCQTLGRAQDEESQQFLRAVLEKNKHRSAQAQACAALAQQAENRLRLARQFKEEPEMAKQYEGSMGKEAVEKLVKADPEELSKEAEDLYERVVKDFADEFGTIGSLATRLGILAKEKLEMLRHPTIVGKPAPEIEGQDIDGKKFKLSDYRGKVVLLDFWGNW